MTHDFLLGRDDAELLVELLERNYVEWHVGNYGLGADIAVHLREAFGMGPQDMRLESSNDCNP